MLRAVQMADLVARHDKGTDDPRLWTNVLAEVPLFAGLNARHRRKIADAATVRRFADGVVLMKNGEPGEALHVVLDGAVTVEPPNRRRLTLGVGSFVGELALLDDGPRTATVVTKGETVTLAISRAKFRKLLESEPRIAIAIAAELAGRLRSV